MEGFIKQLRENWVLILFIGMMIASWTTFNNRLAQAEDHIKELSNVAQILNDLDKKVAVIQNDIQYIKLKVQ